MKTQNGQLWVFYNKEKANALVVLLHCSFHNVNHKKFQSSGIKKQNKQQQLLSVGYLIVFFEDLDKIVFALFSPLFI